MRRPAEAGTSPKHGNDVLPQMCRMLNFLGFDNLRELFALASSMDKD